MLVPRSVFQLHKMTCPDHRRYALGGIRFERSDDGQPIAVATDGRRLMAATWREDGLESYPEVLGNPFVEVGPIIVPASICKQVIEVSEVMNRPPSLSGIRNVRMVQGEPGGRFSIELAGKKYDTILLSSPLEGRFPHWRETFNKARSGVQGATTVLLTGERWEGMLATFRKMGIECVTLAVDNHETRMILTGQNEDGVSVAGLLMPNPCDKDRDPPVIGWTPATTDSVDD
ncbi:hypothetical protein LCGC14_1510000 [marine sediment metagenome]|uniref:DNA polymerase III beta sliding clamp central domain-containing protein n=1 Tax=marine sediment metagenome TaxID=412755 RepID=A0A0F9JMD3_9ZZZZ